MERMQPESKHTEWSGTLVIIRDVLIFLMFLLTFALIYMVSPELLSGGASAKATAQTSTAVLAESSDPTATPASTPQANVVLTASTAAVSTQTPSPTPEPTPSPTPDPAANGDFFATFPTYDTGMNALYSYQTDTVKIAIDKVQSDGVTYFVADVYVKSIDAFKTAYAKDSYGRGLHEMPLKVAADNNAVFAVSGDYYGAREQGVVARNGVLYRDVMGDDVCILRKDGTLSVYQKSSFSPLDMLDETVWQAWAFGPALVRDGAACDTSSSRIKVKNPRSAIGYYAPGHYCFIVVDGRQNGYSTGMTLDELANTFVSLGCVTAYNLDGGATAEFLTSNISKWLILLFALCSILNGLFSAVFLFQKQKQREGKRNHPQTRAAYGNGQLPQQRLAPPEYNARGHLPQQRQQNGYIPAQGYPAPQQRNVNGGLPKYPGEQSGPENEYRDSYRR